MPVASLKNPHTVSEDRKFKKISSRETKMRKKYQMHVVYIVLSSIKLNYKIGAIPQPSFFCILNADIAIMIPPIPKSWPQSHRSLLNHMGFMAQAKPLCRDHRERHLRSGTNTLVEGSLRPLLHRPQGLETAQRGKLQPASGSETHQWPCAGLVSALDFRTRAPRSMLV